MNKVKSHAFGKDVYLLGKDASGVRYWLEQGKFDCGWYWSIGYVETYYRNCSPLVARDIDSHQHFDSMFLNKAKLSFDVFNDFFAESPLTAKEIWRLLELMKSLYTMRAYSDMLYRGGAHYTDNPCQSIIKNPTEYKRINEEVIPALLAEVYALLTP